MINILSQPISQAARYNLTRTVTTTAKGDAFEYEVFRAISQELASEALGLLPAACKVFRKKRYPSRDRGTDIIVDISIEVTLPDAPRWSLLWVWECKDYRANVPVNDLEEFWAKLQQIGGVNIKGGVATTAALARGALAFARAKGIAVVRILPPEQVRWILHWISCASAASDDEALPALLDPNFSGQNRAFYALDDNRSFGDWKSLLVATLQPSA